MWGRGDWEKRKKGKLCSGSHDHMRQFKKNTFSFTMVLELNIYTHKKKIEQDTAVK